MSGRSNLDADQDPEDLNPLGLDVDSFQFPEVSQASMPPDDVLGLHPESLSVLNPASPSLAARPASDTSITPQVDPEIIEHEASLLKDLLSGSEISLATARQYISVYNPPNDAIKNSSVQTVLLHKISAISADETAEDLTWAVGLLDPRTLTHPKHPNTVHPDVLDVFSDAFATYVSSSREALLLLASKVSEAVKDFDEACRTEEVAAIEYKVVLSLIDEDLLLSDLSDPKCKSEDLISHRIEAFSSVMAALGCPNARIADQLQSTSALSERLAVAFERVGLSGSDGKVQAICRLFGLLPDQMIGSTPPKKANGLLSLGTRLLGI